MAEQIGEDRLAHTSLQLTALNMLDCHFVYGSLFSFIALLNNLVSME